MTGEKRVALVTGAGSGIGKACARALLAEGWSVVLSGRRREQLEAAAAGSDAGERALVAPVDITRPDAVRLLFQRTKETFGRLDLLFNNAGVGEPPCLLEDMTPEQWQAVVDTNLSGAFYCTQEAFKIMRAQEPRGGRIINNGSISAHVPRINSVAYTATKHAVTGLTKATSLDGRKYDIACGQIDIGNARTEMVERLQRDLEDSGTADRAEPTMGVEHVARALVYMADLPLEANVQFITVMATKMPFIGRG